MTEEQAIPTSQTPARTRQDIGVLIQDELSIAGITEESFRALKEEAQALVPMEVSSDADAQELQRVITKGVRMCSTISATIEPGKKWAHQLHKAYTSNENEFLGTVKAIIEPLKQKKAAYVAEQERVEQEALEARERAIRERFAKLEACGFVRRTMPDGDVYMIGDTVLPVLTISTAEDEVWANMIRGIEIAFSEEQERLRAEAERAENEKKAMSEREAEIEKREKAMRDAVITIRKNELIAIGCVERDGCMVIEKAFGKDAGQRLYSIPIGDLYGATEPGMEIEKGVAQQRKQALDAAYAQEELEREEAQRLAERRHKEKERYDALIAAGYGSECGDEPGDGCVFTIAIDGSPVSIEHSEAYALDVVDFAALVRKGQEELQRRERRRLDAIKQKAIEDERARQEQERIESERKEAERVKALGDAGRWQEWADSIKKSAPVMESEIGAHAVKRVINGIVSMTPGLLNDLSK